MGAPQWIFLVLGILTWVGVAFKHGEPRGNYSIGEQTFNLVVTLGLLYWGGFFN